MWSRARIAAALASSIIVTRVGLASTAGRVAAMIDIAPKPA
jgi:hypothetical protein